MGETDTESMEREKLWDARRPTMNRWWETAIDENDLAQDTMTYSPEAQQAARLWIEQNVRKTPQTVKKNSPRKTDRPKCRIVIQAAEKKCAGMASANVIKSGVNGLIEAVCRLHDTWRAGPMAFNREFNDELRELVRMLKCLDKDLNNKTAGKCDQLALLAEKHNRAWDRYYTLCAKLNGHRMDDDSGRHGPTSTRKQSSRDRVKLHGCKLCNRRDKEMKI